MRKLIVLCILSIFLFVGCGPKEKPASTDEIKPTNKLQIDEVATVTFPDPDKFIGVDVQPELTHEGQPDYPSQAMRNGITGWVIVQAYVSESGRVLKAQINQCKPCNEGFEEAAIWAAYENRYKPATSNGLAVGVWISYKVKFTLERP